MGKGRAEGEERREEREGREGTHRSAGYVQLSTCTKMGLVGLIS